MEHLEEIKRYISHTKVNDPDKYCMRARDMQALYKLLSANPYKALTLAFDYGQAKGYRAANAVK